MSRIEARHRPLRLQSAWADAIPEKQWEIYQAAVQAVRQSQVPFLLGGGFALAAFIGRWRDTKDIDLYIPPGERDRAEAALRKAGFEDYYGRLAYDRKWICRSIRNDVIVDLIWSMANQRAQVDDEWFKHAGSMSIRGEALGVIPREEFMWCKLYILQRDHCDWTDLFNVLHACGPRVDWPRLLKRLGEDRPLLKALLTVYGWLSPAGVSKLPGKLWTALNMRRPPPGKRPPPGTSRTRLIDSRYWFAAEKPPGHRLEV